ncbi:MAG: L-aspartate oxidase [Firmicutes bacterium]|nr:L-aspartate oxidase [Bacillota bacterium]
MSAHDPIQVDFAVVGCGIAGLRAAIALGAAGSVLVLAKDTLTESATEYAQGGIAAALSDDDEVTLHEQDTLAAGDGLCNVEAVRILVQEGPRYIQELMEWGARFDRAGTRLAFTREGAHSRSRVLHAQGDSTGREISRALFARASSIRNIQFRAHAFTTELLCEEGRVIGLRFLDEVIGVLHDVHARAVLLATGGLGQVYSETTNPEVATGDGMAIAYDAGAVLSDLEFVQFHPTALAVKGAPRFLLSEALRGEGGVLRNAILERFMKRYHAAQELAPRDIVARAIVSEMQRTGAEFVYLDLTHLGSHFLRKRFPRIYETCLRHGLDIGEDLVPVRPAAHYAMGGVRTDLWGRTSLPGLYAAGETAATGVHGANRLASNSLLEGLVFGARAGQAMVEDLCAKTRSARRRQSAGVRRKAVRTNPGKENSARVAAFERDPRFRTIQQILWRQVGIIRNGTDLEQAIETLRAMEIERCNGPSRAACELYNVWILGQLIARCALARQESRGSHYRSDYPIRNDEQFARHSVVRRDSEVGFE